MPNEVRGFHSGTDKITVTDFGGLTDSTNPDTFGAANIRNFRFKDDGNLTKRNGHYYLRNFTEPVRGFWDGSLSGEHFTLIVAGNNIYRLTDNNQLTELYVCNSSSGDISFSVYQNTLFCFDGGYSVLRFIPFLESFTESFGYVPLYGKNWHPTNLGSVNEGLNIFQPKIRISYLNPDGASVIQLPFPAKRLDRVVVNRQTITNYSFIPNSSSFTLPADRTFGTIEVAMTLTDLLDRRTTITSCKKSAALILPKKQVLVTYDGEYVHRLYHTSPVTDAMLQGAQAFYSNADFLYFRADNQLALGDTTCPIRSVLMEKERLIASTPQCFWGIDFNSSDNAVLEAYPIQNGYGSEGATLYCHDRLYSVRSDGIYQNAFSESDRSDCSSLNISAPIQSLIQSYSPEQMILFYNRLHDELWIRSKTDTGGLVYVYCIGQKKWTCFDGIQATLFYDTPTRVGFFSSNRQMLYEANTYSFNGATFNAIYQTTWLSSRDAEKMLRSLRAFISGHFINMTLTLETERTSKSFALSAATSGPPLDFIRRIGLGRFRKFRASIQVSNAGRCTIRYLSFILNQ